ncbi:MAG TPA: hydrogen peroxide-inducible genes activator [Methylomirabilota bacterium]|nr:hydrogen peroxide-inducible genes activator [Methylomirabilota bacterium]
MMNIPTLRNLQYLLSLYEHQNFSRAAEDCFVSQSTLSAGILNLEELLGAPLVERTNKTLTFTALGLEVVERARKILQEVEDLTQLSRSWGQPLTGAVRLGGIPTITPFLLPRILADSKEQFPQLELLPKEDLTDRLLDELHHGKLDLALLALPYSASNIVTVSLGRDAFRFICHRESRLVQPPLLSYDDLPDGSILLLEEGHCLRQHAIEACKLKNNAKINMSAIASLHTLVQMVHYDLGVTFLPQLAIDAGILHGTRVAVHEAPAFAAYREIGLAWRKSSARANEFLIFAQWLRTRFFADRRET